VLRLRYKKIFHSSFRVLLCPLRLFFQLFRRKPETELSNFPPVDLIGGAQRKDSLFHGQFGILSNRESRLSITIGSEELIRDERGSSIP
jgi:hypothetical protein